jgi:hypothetical protein
MNRYELEHEVIPEMFYEDSKTMMQTISARGNEFFTELYNESIDAEIKYEEQEFSAGVLEYEGSAKICRAFVPKPDKPGVCVILYFITDEEYNPLGYLTVEADGTGGYALCGWNTKLECADYGAFDGNNERTIIDGVAERLLAGVESAEAGGEYAEMADMLRASAIPYYENELSDYIQMFNVIEELTDGQLQRDEMVETFAVMMDIVQDEGNHTSRSKILKEYEKFEELPQTKGKLAHKHKLFFAFCVYAACNIISENDDKKHHYMGIAEFESTEAIKYKMEEYWSMDPFMFDVGNR